MPFPHSDDLKIKKALGKALERACPEAAAAAHIEWPNLPFDKNRCLKTNQGLGYYLKPTFHPVDRRARTLGKRPRVQSDGFMRIGINTETGVSEDLATLIQGRIETGFPYGEPLFWDGLGVEITQVLPGSANPVDGWYYLPVSVHWTLWRAS